MSGEGTDAGAAEATTMESTGQETPQMAAPSPTEQMVEKMSRKFKVKLDGQEHDVDEDELIRGYQLRKVSDQRLQEGVKARKQSEALLEILRTDPKRVLSDPRIGVDIKKFAEDIIYQSLQEEMLSPEQRELQEYKRKVQDYEAKQQKEEQERIQNEQQKLHSQRTETYVTDIRDSLTTAGLPINDYTVAQVVSAMTNAIKAGFSEVTAKDVIEMVHANFVRDTKALYGTSSEETLMKLLGDDVAKKIRNYDINKYKQANSIPKTYNVKGNGQAPTRANKTERAKTPSELRAEIEKKYGIG